MEDVRRVGDHECIHCGECAAECPAGAISMKCGKLTLSEKKRGRARKIAAWAAALAVLAGVGWYANFGTDSAAPQTPPVEQADDDMPVGCEVGMRCPDFIVPLYGAEGGSFTLSQARGKPVVVNFWATWCTPCVNELPYFEAIYEKYGDAIALVAVHSDLVTDNVDEFLAGENLAMPFALDETGEVIASLGGSTMLPMTVILDRDGKIVYNKVGSVTQELLESLIEPLL